MSKKKEVSDLRQQVDALDAELAIIRTEFNAINSVKRAMERSASVKTIIDKVMGELNDCERMYTKIYKKINKEIEKLRDDCKHENTTCVGYDSHNDHHQCDDCGKMFY